jgi:hypothetical protein
MTLGIYTQLPQRSWLERKANLRLLLGKKEKVPTKLMEKTPWKRVRYLE